MRAFCWIVTLLGCAIGALFLVDALIGDKSAPQQAAEAAVAVAFAIIPYCFSRAVDGLADSRRDDLLSPINEIRDTIRTHTPILATIANEAAGTVETPEAEQQKA